MGQQGTETPVTKRLPKSRGSKAPAKPPRPPRAAETVQSRRRIPIPFFISAGLHAVLLLILALFSLTTGLGRKARRDVVVVDTVLDVRHDVFESNEWVPEPKQALRKAGGLRSLDKDLLKANPNDALAALSPDGEDLFGEAGDVASLTEGLGEGGGSGIGSADFFGTAAKGSKIVYVIDRSYSMNANNAMHLAVKELLRSLDSLSPAMEFQVLFYNQETALLDLPGRGLADATPPIVERARQQILMIKPTGGTNHDRALRRALDLKPEIIMFLTDAEEASLSKIDAFTALNKRKSRSRKPATVNVIQFHHDRTLPPDKTIERLAKLNQGTYRLIDTNELTHEWDKDK